MQQSFENRVGLTDYFRLIKDHVVESRGSEGVFIRGRDRAVLVAGAVILQLGAPHGPFAVGLGASMVVNEIITLGQLSRVAEGIVAAGEQVRERF